MKLYYSPGACSLSPHIVLREAGLPFTATKVDLKTKAMDDGGDFRKINEKGYVPTLQLDDGSILTEGPAIVQYVADQAPATGLAPANGTLARYHLQEWLNFISTELHKQFSPLFSPDSTDAVKDAQRAKIGGSFVYIVKKMGSQPYLTGDTFTVADAYLFTVLSWTKWVGIDLAQWPALAAYSARVAARPKVQEALKAEGLVK
ncbi:MAG: glutathione transferase GstA [Betaproteobacteria bacterium]